jgi:protein-S-isoprenylcysteine O-methyltransferase Ste14
VKAVGAKLVLLFVLGIFVLNFPVLAIFNRSDTLAGIPVLYLYLFGVWVAGIAAVWVLARARWEDEE